MCSLYNSIIISYFIGTIHSRLNVIRIKKKNKAKRKNDPNAFDKQLLRVVEY